MGNSKSYKFNIINQDKSDNGYFTSQDLEIYNKVGKFMSPEKSQNPKAFDESIPPSFLLYILNGN